MLYDKLEIMISSGDPHQVDVLFQAGATLAEGPVWDSRLECIYWIDIRRRRIARFDVTEERQTGVWITQHRPGCVALTDNREKLLIAAGDKIEILDLPTGTTQEIARLPIDVARFRVNDGRVDPQGRLWIGTMIDDIHAPDVFSGGALIRVDPDGTVFKVKDEFELPNGIGWNPDGSLLYMNDTTAQVTYSFEFDVSAGTVSNKQVLYDHSAGDGFPDGLSVDAAGCIWSAQWDGWNIRKISPNGELLAQIPMPVRRPSSAAFYGKHLSQLVITSATVDFSTEDFLKSPDAGSLYSMPVETAGVPGTFFALQK